VRAALAQAHAAWSDEVRRAVQPGAEAAGTSLEWCDSLPDDPQELYRIFPKFWDDSTRDWAPRLARYQVDIWHDLMDNRFGLYPKAQKLGLTSFLRQLTAYKALKTDRGNSMYIVSQNMDIAKMHLEALKDYFRSSPALRPYLIETPVRDEGGRLIRGSSSTSTEAVIANPEHPTRFTRIYAKAIIGGQSLISHAHVSHIHMTDISAAEMTEERMEDNFGKTLSRLLNTRGSMVVESPPSLYPNGLMTRLLYRALDECRERGVALDDGTGTTALNRPQLELAAAAGLDAVEPDGEFARDGRAYHTRDWVLRRLHWQVGVRDGTLTIDEVETERRKMHELTFERLMEARIRTGENRAYDRGMADQVDEGATTDFVNDMLEKTGGYGGHGRPGGGFW